MDPSKSIPSHPIEPSSSAPPRETRAHLTRAGRAVLLLVGLAVSHIGGSCGLAIAAEARRPAEVHALLINGGSSASRNYLSHFHHLQDMVAALKARGVPLERIHVFSADGEDVGKDMAVRTVEPEDFWLIAGTAQARLLNPVELTDSTWNDVAMRPARRRDLRRWFAGMSDELEPGDTLLIFVTDHGNKDPEDPGNGTIALWNENLSVLEFRAMLGYIPPGVRIASVMSQCYSGAFADAMTPLHSRVPSGDICGFYSTTADRPSFGCYPEGRDRDRLGHAFNFIDALARHPSLDESHAAVLVTDTSPDVPVRTSDLYLERVLEDEAAQRGIEMDELVDRLLAVALRDRGRWEPEIRLLDRIGEVYGMFSPRALAEMKPKIESLEALSKELDTYEDRWRLALNDLRKENMERFLEQDPDMKDRLEDKQVQTLEPAERRALLLDTLAAIKAYDAERPDIGARLQSLYESHEDAKKAKYRVDVRLGALLRMRALLIRIAATTWLQNGERALAESAAAKAAGAAGEGAAGAVVGAGEGAAGDLAALADSTADAPTEGAPTTEAAVPTAKSGSALASRRLGRATMDAPRDDGAIAAAEGETARAERTIEAARRDAAATDRKFEAAVRDLDPTVARRPGARTASALDPEARPARAASKRPRLEELRRALDVLLECEAAVIGSAGPAVARPAGLEWMEPLPPFEEDLAAARRALPSWLGIHFRALTEKQQSTFEAGRGAVIVEQIVPDGPASAAGIAAGDIILGPPDAHFKEPNQVREWTMTSPRDTPLALDVLRDGETIPMTVSLAPYPTEFPALPPPPGAGDEAPELGTLSLLRSGSPADSLLAGRRHLLFFWATWCAPCKASLPELMAWSRQSKVPILSISDEDEQVISKFLASWTGPFPETVANDELRRLYLAYGVSGSPTFVLVDEQGKIEWRQVGYSQKGGLSIPGWTWSGRSRTQ